MNTYRFALLIVACYVSLFLAGCGRSTGNIAGQVKINGRPLPAGRVIFFCEAGDKPVVTAQVENGAYEVAGIPAGAAKIAVQAYRSRAVAVPGMPVGMQVIPAGDSSAARLPTPAGPFVPIPTKYQGPDSSGLSCTIEQGDQTHDIELMP